MTLPCSVSSFVIFFVCLQQGEIYAVNVCYFCTSDALDSEAPWLLACSIPCFFAVMVKLWPSAKMTWGNVYLGMSYEVP